MANKAATHDAAYNTTGRERRNYQTRPVTSSRVANGVTRTRLASKATCSSCLSLPAHASWFTLCPGSACTHLLRTAWVGCTHCTAQRTLHAHARTAWDWFLCCCLPACATHLLHCATPLLSCRLPPVPHACLFLPALPACACTLAKHSSPATHHFLHLPLLPTSPPACLPCLSLHPACHSTTTFIASSAAQPQRHIRCHLLHHAAPTIPCICLPLFRAVAPQQQQQRGWFCHLALLRLTPP